MAFDGAIFGKKDVSDTKDTVRSLTIAAEVVDTKMVLMGSRKVAQCLYGDDFCCLHKIHELRSGKYLTKSVNLHFVVISIIYLISRGFWIVNMGVFVSAQGTLKFGGHGTIFCFGIHLSSWWLNICFVTEMVEQLGKETLFKVEQKPLLYSQQQDDNIKDSQLKRLQHRCYRACHTLLT